MTNIQNKLRRRLHTKSFSYDTNIYHFKEILDNLFGCECSRLHKHLGKFDEFQRMNDQSTLAHKVFYSNFKNKIFPLYKSFQNNFISKIVLEPYYFQLIPTFRIGLPGNKFVGEFHKDSDYNHKDYEINFNLGICGYTGKASLKTESSPSSNEFIHLECPYGKIFSFDHIDCLHGSDINETDSTMVSFDFRIALKSLYFNSDSTSVNTKTGLNIGEYFSKKEVNSK